jgi:hypothetical protein
MTMGVYERDFDDGRDGAWTEDTNPLIEALREREERRLAREQAITAHGINLDGKPKFIPGPVVMTASIVYEIKKGKPDTGIELAVMLARHLSGDWGETTGNDAAMNEEALVTGERICSSYHTSKGLHVWIITDRCCGVDPNGRPVGPRTHYCTTILEPSDY